MADLTGQNIQDTYQRIIQIDNGSPYRRCPSIKKYKRIDNKIQFTSLKVGLKNTLGWYLNNNKSKII